MAELKKASARAKQLDSLSEFCGPFLETIIRLKSDLENSKESIKNLQNEVKFQEECVKEAAQKVAGLEEENKNLKQEANYGIELFNLIQRCQNSLGSPSSPQST
jgi:predicted nuclease with TOPRIM domain